MIEVSLFIDSYWLRLAQYCLLLTQINFNDVNTVSFSHCQ